MTRRSWLVLSLLLPSLLIGSLPGVARAQTAQATQVKVFAPWGQGLMPQLNPNITVTAREMLEGNPSINGASCQSGAITTSRPDAWRCVTADPCFTPSLIGGDQVFCTTTPWSGEGVLITLTAPITRDTVQCMGGPTCQNGRNQLSFGSPPWAVELTNGARCVKGTGTLSGVGPLTLTYFCTAAGGQPGGSVALYPETGSGGGIDRSDPLWKVLFLPNSGFAFEQMGVLVAWY
jgi:hypothetical protein